MPDEVWITPPAWGTRVATVVEYRNDIGKFSTV